MAVAGTGLGEPGVWSELVARDRLVASYVPLEAAGDRCQVPAKEGADTQEVRDPANRHGKMLDYEGIDGDSQPRGEVVG